MLRMRDRHVIVPIVVAILILGSLGTVLWRHETTSAAATVVIAITTDTPAPTPRLVLAQPGEQVVFSNGTGAPLQLQTTPHAAGAFHLTVPPGGSAYVRLIAPGTYHYYDAATAHVIDYQADNDVVHTLSSAPDQNLPDQGWIIVPGPQGVPYDAYVHVPAGHDLLDAHVTAIRVGGSVVFHNMDSDAHNLVTDPADPSGTAFELLGTDGEPTIGGAAQRVTFTRPGLYHLYCSIHARIVGTVGGWQVVVPRNSNASGYADGDPMQAWVLVTP